jgi:hypothetical protein
MEIETKFWTCIACARNKHEKCWGTWIDHTTEQPWRCDCWECTLAHWITYEQLPRMIDDVE